MSEVVRICLVPCFLYGSFAMSFAQTDDVSYFERDKNISVKERPKPEYQTDGIRSGVLVYKPELIIASEYTDNVFAEEVNKESDVFTTVAPSIKIHTDRNIHELEFNAGLETRQYFNNSSESHTNFESGLRGRLDVTRGAYLNAGASFRRDHEDRSTAGGARIAEERISVDSFESFVGGYRESGRTRAQGAVRYRTRNYEDGLLPDGTRLNQDFRDRTDWVLELRGDYAISPDTAVFTRATYVDGNYDDDGVASLDQQNLTFEVGTDFEVSELVRGQASIGLSNVSFDAPVREDFDSLSYQVGLEWFASPLITVETNASRRARPSSLIESSSILEDQISVRADYEWRRNIVYSIGGSYRNSDFRDLDRDDNRMSYFVSGTYQMNRNVGFSTRLSHTKLDSDGVFQQSDFNETQLMVGIVLRK